MNWKWNITVLIAALAFFGISLDQTHLDPNQEIVIQFNTSSISAQQVQNAVSDIKSQLKSLGIEDVQVVETTEGRLKVTYYSPIDVSVIENLFEKQNKLVLDHSHGGAIPDKDGSNPYIVEVVQIQSCINVDMSMQGVLVEVKGAFDQYVKPKVFVDAPKVDIRLKRDLGGALGSCYGPTSPIITNDSYKIPEVRAGPLS